MNKHEIEAKYKERDSQKRNNSLLFRRYQSYTRVQKLDKLLLKIDKGILKNGLLDVGCGDGWFLRYMYENFDENFQYTGIDYLVDRIQRAKVLSINTFKFFDCDIEELNDSYKYGLVSAFTVLSSIGDKNQQNMLLRSMWDRVIPGGYLLVFDLRYRNLNNSDVNSINSSDIMETLQVDSGISDTGTVPPVLFDIFGPSGSPLIEKMLPFLRCHFYLLIQKDSV